MNAFYVLGFLCLLSVVASHDGGYGHGRDGYGDGEWNKGGHFRFSAKDCFDSKRFLEASSKIDGCQDLTQKVKTSAPSDKGRHGKFNWDRLNHIKHCFATTFKLKNEKNDTIIANAVEAIRSTTRPEKADALADAYKTCAGPEETFTQEQEDDIVQCYFRKVLEICPKAQRAISTPASSGGSR